MRKTKQHDNHPFLAALAEVIRNRRVDLLVTQDQLSSTCDLHRTYVTELEAGVRNMSILTLLKVSTALSIPLSRLIHDTEAQMAATTRGDTIQGGI